MRYGTGLKVQSCVEIGYAHLSVECGACMRVGTVEVADLMPHHRHTPLDMLPLKCRCGAKFGAVKVRPVPTGTASAK